LSVVNAVAQHQGVIIYTPANTPIFALDFIGVDYTTQQKNDRKDYWLSFYNNRIEYIAEATHKYNCHAYAWHVSEGGSQVWINTPGQETYWNDYSYVETSNLSNATKVSFGGPCYYLVNGQLTDSCDHSAITTATLNYFISKWGPSPRFKHHKNDCPYSTEDLHYYARLIISGVNNPYSLQQVTYSVANIPPGTSETWTHSNNVYIINGQGTNQVTIQICGGTTATLTVTLLGTVNHVLTKTLTVNNGTFTAMPAADGTGTIVTLNHPYASCFDWEISSALNSIVGNGTKTCISNNSLSFAALAYNNEIVQVRAKNGSCTTPWFSANVIKWVPTLNVATSNLTPGPLGNKGARGTFTAYLTSPCPVADARYHWNFDFDYTNINLNWDTYIPQISANVCPCGDHYLTIEVYDMNNYSVVSNSFIFYGTCVFPMLIYSAPAPIGGSLFKVYEDPLNSDPIIDEKDNLDIDSKAKNPNIDFKTKDTYSETTALSLNIGSWSAAYPNPTNTELIIDIIGVNNLENTTTTTKVLLYSHSTTKLVFSQDYPISTQQIKIDTSKLPNGVYYLNIIENGEKMKEQTIIVNH